MTYRVLAHIENSEGIYIAAECPLEHSANGGSSFLILISCSDCSVSAGCSADCFLCCFVSDYCSFRSF